MAAGAGSSARAVSDATSGAWTPGTVSCGAGSGTPGSLTRVSGPGARAMVTGAVAATVVTRPNDGCGPTTRWRATGNGC